MSSTPHNHRRNSQRESSPTRTERVQRNYRIELESRIEKLRGVIRTTIVDNNALGIKGGAETRVHAEEPQSEPNIDPREEFSFEYNAVKQAAFRQQVQEWIDEGILEPISREGVENGEHYTAIYVSSAYREGVRFADNRMEDAGMQIPDEDAKVVVGRPIHEDALRRLYTRNYEGLEDITEDMDSSISRVLSESMRDGLGTRDTADRITAEVRDIQRTRARALARTEMLSAHNESSLNRYERFGVQEVDILTHTPCEICRAIAADAPYSLAEARNRIPAHPNCVCTWAPEV